MAKRFFRGDAPAVAKVQRIKPPLVDGAITFQIGNKSLTFSTWSAAAIATAWNGSTHAEFRGAVASASGSDLLLTARTAGVPFFVVITIASDEGQDEVQIITLVNAPAGGTWNVAFDGDDADIAYNASAATVQTALEGLSTIEVGDVAVTGDAGGPWTVTFGGRFAEQNVSSLVVDGSNLTGGNSGASIDTVQDGDSTGGLTVDRTYTTIGTVYWPDDNPEAGANWFANSVAQYLGRDVLNEQMHHLLLVFELPTIPFGASITAASLHVQSVGNVSMTISGVCYGSPDVASFAGTANAIANDVMTRELTAAAEPFGWDSDLGDSKVDMGDIAHIIQELVNSAYYATDKRVHLHLRVNSGDGLCAVFDNNGAGYGTVPTLHVETGGLAEIQTVALTGTPRSGQVTLDLDGETAAALDFDATAAEAQAAIEALSNVGAGNVLCSGGPWPATITFSFAASLGDLPQMTATDTLVNANVIVTTVTSGGPAVTIVEEQRSRGPNHWDDPLNWQDEAGAFGVPQRLDQFYLGDNQVDLLYGLCQRTAFTADPATDRLLLADPQIALWEGQAVELVTEDTLPGGLSDETTYYIRDLDPSGPYVRVSTTLDGPPVAITSAGTGPHYLGVHFTYGESDAKYRGRLGLARTNREAAFLEYRTRFLAAWIDALRIGRGDGDGSTRFHVDTRGLPVNLQQVASSGSSDNVPAVQWLGNGAGNTLEILSGDCGIAIDADQASEFDALKIRGGQVLVGPNVTAGDIERTGGSLRMLGATVDGSVEI